MSRTCRASCTQDLILLLLRIALVRSVLKLLLSSVYLVVFFCGPSVRPSPGHRTDPVRANTNVFHVISGGALGTCWFWFHFVFFSCHILVFSFVSCLCLGFEPSSHACLLFILLFSGVRMIPWMFPWHASVASHTGWYTTGRHYRSCAC